MFLLDILCTLVLYAALFVGGSVVTVLGLSLILNFLQHIGVCK